MEGTWGGSVASAGRLSGGFVGGRRLLTTTGRVVPRLLPEVGVVLHCEGVSVGLRVWLVVSRGNVHLALKNWPEMLRDSHRTMTTFWPFRSCLATIDARRPRRWPLPSMTTCVGNRQRAALSNECLLSKANRPPDIPLETVRVATASSPISSVRPPQVAPSRFQGRETHNRLETGHRSDGTEDDEVGVRVLSTTDQTTVRGGICSVVSSRWVDVRRGGGRTERKIPVWCLGAQRGLCVDWGPVSGRQRLARSGRGGERILKSAGDLALSVGG